jgi:hypothetical protein
LKLKQPGREADHSPPTSAVVKNKWIYTFTPAPVFMAQCLTNEDTQGQTLPFVPPFYGLEKKYSVFQS